MRRLPWLLSLAALTLPASPARAAGPEDSIVRVFATLRLPNPIRPWTKQNPVEVMGTGVIIDGGRILTNAHVVLYATEVAVQPRLGGDRFEARVATVGPGIDLATLVLDDPSFLVQRPVMPRAPGRPESMSAVTLYGFPVGGSGLAVTKGVVSRVEYAGYGDDVTGMRLQVDAAVNPGSSGGPALIDGKMVGLTFGQLGQAENVGYVIPNEEIDAYLDDVKDGRYDGKPHLADHYQKLENEALRAKLGLGREVRGLMIRRPARADSAYPLREGDVLTHLGEVALDNEGMVAAEGGLQLPFLALIPRLAKGGAVPARLLRDGKPLDVAMPVSNANDRLIKPYAGKYPRYFVHGPLVFSPAASDAAAYYMRLNPDAVLGGPMLARSGDREAFPGEELVVVTSPLQPHKVAKGYDDPFGLVIADVDGVKVKNFRHLVELLRDGRGEFLTIRFCGEDSEVLVFRREAIEGATADVMAENGIPRRGTDDVLAVWDAKSMTAR